MDNVVVKRLWCLLKTEAVSVTAPIKREYNVSPIIEALCQLTLPREVLLLNDYGILRLGERSAIVQNA